MNLKVIEKLFQDGRNLRMKNPLWLFDHSKENIILMADSTSTKLGCVFTGVCKHGDSIIGKLMPPL